MGEVRTLRVVGAEERKSRAEAIMARCAELFEVDAGLAYGGARDQMSITVRWAAMLCLSRRGWACVQIGRLFGRDHSTVSHGIVRAEQIYRTEPEFREVVDIVLREHDASDLSRQGDRLLDSARSSQEWARLKKEAYAEIEREFAHLVERIEKLNEAVSA